MLEKNLKILIFSLAYYPKHVGGAEVAIKEITDRLPDIEFHLICLRFDRRLSREERIGNVIVHRIGWGYSRPSQKIMLSLRYRFIKFWFQFAAAWHGHRLNKKYSFDLLWAMMAHSTGVPAALFKVIHPKIPYLLVLQEGDPPEYIERLMRPLWPLFSRAFTSANFIVAESTFLGRWARRRGFSGPLEVIPNGMNGNHFLQTPPQTALAMIKKTIGKRDGETWLIHTGRLVHKNALDVVIQALVHLPESIHFFMIGDGPDKEALTALADTLAVSTRVHFHPYVPLSEIPNYLGACDIFIRPSRSEGMGNSFIEAMAAGLPVIATQEGGIADFLFDADRNPDTASTGWAVDTDSSLQIATAVTSILAHPEQVIKVVEHARHFVSKQYDWNAIAVDMRSVLTHVITTR